MHGGVVPASDAVAPASRVAWRALLLAAVCAALPYACAAALEHAVVALFGALDRDASGPACVAVAYVAVAARLNCWPIRLWSEMIRAELRLRIERVSSCVALAFNLTRIRHEARYAIFIIAATDGTSIDRLQSRCEL